MLNSKVHLRSSLQSIPDDSPSPFDRIVHDRGLSTSAASGGLKPPPIRRLRWAHHHLLYSIATRAFLTHLGLPPFRRWDLWEHVDLTGDYVWRQNNRAEKGDFRLTRPLACYIFRILS